MKHYTIRVYGKVQGVFYRASSQEKAAELGLTGWVKNEVDGSVLIGAEGPEDKLQDFISWCHKGPTKASVEKVTYAEDELQEYESFEVKR